MSLSDRVYFEIDGRKYTFLGGFGAQLHSIESNHISKGSVRYIGDRLFYVFSIQPLGLFHKRYDIAWGMVLDNPDLDTMHANIASFKKYLEKMI